MTRFLSVSGLALAAGLTCGTAAFADPVFVLTTTDANHNFAITDGTYYENGFTITLAGGPDGDQGVSGNGPSYAMAVFGGTFTYTITATDAGAFTFNSIAVGDTFDGGSGDTLVVTGTTIPSGSLSDTMTGGPGLVTNDAVNLLNQPLSSLELSGFSANSSFANVSLTEQPAPEPASLALLGTGLVGLAWRRRRRSA